MPIRPEYVLFAIVFCVVGVVGRSARAETPPAEYDDILPSPSLLTLSPCRDIVLPLGTPPINALGWNADTTALALTDLTGATLWIGSKPPFALLPPQTQPKSPPEGPTGAAVTPPKPSQNPHYAQSTDLRVSDDQGAALSLYAWYTETTELILWSPRTGEVQRTLSVREPYTHIAWLAPDASVALLFRSFDGYSLSLLDLIDLKTGKRRARVLIPDAALPADSDLPPPPLALLSVDRHFLWAVRRDFDTEDVLMLCHLPGGTHLAP